MLLSPILWLVMSRFSDALDQVKMATILNTSRHCNIVFVKVKKNGRGKHIFLKIICEKGHNQWDISCLTSFKFWDVLNQT